MAAIAAGGGEIRGEIRCQFAFSSKHDDLTPDLPKSEILRKALTLFVLARDGKRHGKNLALVGEGGQVATEIFGL